MLLSAAVIKSRDKDNLEKKSLFWLMSGSGGDRGLLWQGRMAASGRHGD